ncbi:MAG: zf-TFIIB domain-containing protein [Candidatus Eisenbacteria bacterium]
MPALTMKCPRCAEGALVTTDRHDIEIEICPTCRGVWLDRGELDKLIERSLGTASGAWRSHDHDTDDRRRETRGEWRRPYDDDDDDDRHHRRRKTNWLKELFD